MNNIGDTYLENFNSLITTGTASWIDNTTLTGWYANEPSCNADNGSSTTGALYSYGSTAGIDRALGSSASAGTGTIDYGVRIKNNSCYPITSLDITYTGEQWRDTNSAIHQLLFQYQINATGLLSGTWTSFTSLDFPSPQTGNTGAIDGNLAGNKITISATLTATIPAGEEIWLRWRDTDDANQDHGLSIDDLSVTANGSTTTAYWYFRSAASGDWNMASTWEASCDSTVWVAAIQIPSYLAKTIVVRNAHTVIINSNDTIDQLIIDSGATLIYNAGDLAINNGTGIDLTVNGTFEDNASTNITWNASSSWLLGTNGTLLRTRSTSANNWQNNYEGGISNIPVTANWIVRKTGMDNPSMTAVGMYYPNLTIENMSGSGWITSVGTSFTGSADYPRIKGNLDIGGNGNSIVSFANNNKNTNPCLVQGDLIVRPTDTLRNYGTGFEIRGDLVVDGTIIYDTDDDRKLVFTDSASQSINGSGIINIHYLEINKSNNNLLLNRAITIDSVLVLAKKNIVSSMANLVILMAGASATGASDSSFVDGPCRKTGTTDFVFPVGKDQHYRLVAVSGLLGIETFTAEYFHQDPHTATYDVTLKDATLDHISRCEYWMVGRTGAQSAFVTLSWDSYSCGVTSPGDLRVARWDGTLWRDHGNGGITGGADPLPGTIITTSTVSSFSPFTLASAIPWPENPLPVEILDFRANVKQSAVELTWTITSEKNVEYYLVERSEDGRRFEVISKIKSTETSNAIHQYQYLDTSPLYPVNYYRLRQTDWDGDSRCSRIISVSFYEQQIVEIYFNPTDHVIQIENSNPASSPIIILSDLSGKQLLTQSIPAGNTSSFIDISHFFKGIYFIRVFNEREWVVKKIIK